MSIGARSGSPSENVPPARTLVVPLYPSARSTDTTPSRIERLAARSLIGKGSVGRQFQRPERSRDEAS